MFLIWKAYCFFMGSTWEVLQHLFWGYSKQQPCSKDTSSSQCAPWKFDWPARSLSSCSGLASWPSPAAGLPLSAQRQGPCPRCPVPAAAQQQLHTTLMSVENFVLHRTIPSKCACSMYHAASRLHRTIPSTCACPMYDAASQLHAKAVGLGLC